jgi:16S rRNA (cytidine1402-2'-O)-methyltransferase
MSLDHNVKHGVLYVVATPIGHLDDITLRAVSVLQKVGVVLAEDTRVTAPLLRHINAQPPKLLSCDQYREQERSIEVLNFLRQGTDVAYVSDAGTPGISDPGAVLVRTVRAAQFKVVPIPGCSAMSALISVAGLSDGQFLFEGFLPASHSKRVQRLNQLKTSKLPVVFYEAPHRIEAFAQDLLDSWGAHANVVVGRELTKMFEEIWSGGVNELTTWLNENPNRVRGEFVVIATPQAVESESIDSQTFSWLTALVPLLGTKAAAKVVSQVSGAPKNALYQAALELKTKPGTDLTND